MYLYGLLFSPHYMLLGDVTERQFIGGLISLTLTLGEFP